LKKIAGYAVAFVLGSALSGGAVMAATNYVQALKGDSVIQLNGNAVEHAPKLVYGGTTYVQLYSIQQALKQAGFGANWDGSHITGLFNMTSSETATNTPVSTANEIISLSQHQQWDVLYSYLDPDVQAKYTEAQFISERQQNGSAFATVKSFTVQPSTTLSTWSDASGTGNTYSNVADVPFTLTLDDGTTISGNMHLTKASDGNWRYFWSPST